MIYKQKIDLSQLPLTGLSMLSSHNVTYWSKDAVAKVVVDLGFTATPHIAAA